jgi:hypothetical protein
MHTAHSSVLRVGMITASILLLPLLAMQFTDEVVWTPLDFVVFGVLLFGALGAYELVARATGEVVFRLAAGLALTAAFLLIWVNGAVGIIGDGDNPTTPMYFGVLAVGIIGAFMARLNPRGMARALFATALAQASVPVIALVVWDPQVNAWGAAGVWGVFGLNAFFVVLFIGSALLFGKAARQRSHADLDSNS